MARNVDNVVDTAADPVISLVVTTSSITRELRRLAKLSLESLKTYVVALVHVQVCVHVTLVSTPHSAGHAGPRLLKGKHTLDIVTRDLLARDGVDDGGLNTEERKRSATRLGRSDTTERSNDVGAGLGLPIGLTGCECRTKFEEK